ncbi:MAG TPA: UDP-N-acetylmuramate--L-alanine ligase [bacterium]|nr:UDP-N-acetylmuramate--L-alanine ligase [bacterium]HEX68342.1 UDP-N-acetylmuramate--L-alanine ligase [bacterium]
MERSGGKILEDNPKPAELISPVHLVGIGGVGMSGLAWLLKDLGYAVQGSDKEESIYTRKLKKVGFKIFIGHHKKHVEGAKSVVYSQAIKEDNPEIKRAKELSLPIFHRGWILAHLAKKKKSIVVAGSHGKTTTTAILSYLLHHLGVSSSYYIGGTIKGWERNACWDINKIMVLESDESDASFLYFRPWISIVTSLDDDHLPFYGGMDKLKFAFEEFLRNTSSEGMVIMETRTTPKISIPPSTKVVTYGIGDGEVMATSLKNVQGGVSFVLKINNQNTGRWFLPLPGEHNVENSLPGIYLALYFGGEISQVRKILSKFPGVKRRIEKVGDIKGATIYDDYAHHPTEIKRILGVFSSHRVRVVFQPHRYSRFSYLKKEFANALTGVKEVVLLPVFSAGEKPIPGADSYSLLSLLKSLGVKCCYCQNIQQAIEYLQSSLTNGEIILTLGAGDVWKVGKLLVSQGGEE